MPEKKSPEKNPKTSEISKAYLPEDHVRLKRLFGIRPGYYLACLYGAILLVILFFVLLYPGISNPGSVLVIKSEPWGAAILANGVYKKAAPNQFFLPEGRHQIELRLPGFVPTEFEIDVGSRLFASWPFPRRITLHEKLIPESPAEAFIQYYASEFAAWSFVGEPSLTYQIPLTLSEGVYRLGPEAANPAVKKAMEETLAASARFAVTRAGLRDLVRAKTLLDNLGLSPSPLSLLGSAEDIISFFNDNPQTALWLASVLDGESRSILTESYWYTSSVLMAETNRDLQNQLFSYVPAGTLINAPTVQLGFLSFRLINGGLPLLGENFPAGTTVGSFYISETVISAPAWEAFLQQQPHWRIDNIDTLIREGLVNTEYLESVFGAPAEGVPGISWYAARAFCQWLSNFLPPQFSDWEVRLPTEAEWEYAAKKESLDPSLSLGIGRFWEWCEDPFSPLSFFPASQDGISALGSPERSLRGGSWVNTRGTVGIETRASLPPSFCSPFVSFRPVIAPRER